MARHVFLSFASADLQQVNLFRGQARSIATDLEFYDYSVKEPSDSQDADYIRRKIRELIRYVSVTVCLIGENTWTSKWVDWELSTSASLEKGLLGVTLNDRAWFKPQPLIDHRAKVVSWNISSVVAAIEEAARNAGY